MRATLAIVTVPRDHGRLFGPLPPQPITTHAGLLVVIPAVDTDGRDLARAGHLWP